MLKYTQPYLYAVRYFCRKDNTLKTYVQFRDIARRIDEIFKSTNRHPILADVITSLIAEGKCRPDSPNQAIIDNLCAVSEENFLKGRMSLCLEVDTDFLSGKLKKLAADETRNIRDWSVGHPTDVYIGLLFWHCASSLHTTENYFEMDYVFSGSCRVRHDETWIELNKGDVILFAPNARREVRLKTEDSFVIQGMMDSSTFYTAFISLLSGVNILSNFFKSILLNNANSSYLQLSTGHSPRIAEIARRLYLEQFRFDAYSPQCTTNWFRLLFAYILRDGSKHYRLPLVSSHIEFEPVLDYIAVHYRTATLQEIAEAFHYSQSYLSIAIKQLTGRTYSEIVRERKMENARRYLEQTDKGIEEIAELVGYSTSDQFTRVFKSSFGLPPTQYRKHYLATTIYKRH